MSFPKTVLLVDDDLEDCEILIMALKEYFKWVECNYEQDARAALNRIFDAAIPPPDLVFLDWRMPQISGAEILTMIRTQPRYAGVPVVIFTGTDGSYWEDAQRSGASYLLNKPSTMEALVTDLKHIFELENTKIN